MITRHKRMGTKKEYRLPGEVFYTPAYQSYFSAGDEAEPYCANCDEELEAGMSYCHHCGAKLYTYLQDGVNGFYVEGVN